MTTTTSARRAAGGLSLALMVLGISGCMASAADVATQSLRTEVETIRDYLESSLQHAAPGTSDTDVIRDVFQDLNVEGLTADELEQDPNVDGSGSYWLFAVESEPARAHLLFFEYAHAQTVTGGYYSDYVHSCVAMSREDDGHIDAKHEPCPDLILDRWPWALGVEVGL